MNGRRLVWLVGAPARAVLLTAIAIYRATLSGWLGGQCRFSPTCSAYATDAIRTHGATKGSAMAFVRILRCNPFGKGGLDPVRRRGDRSYDRDIRRGRHAHAR